MVSPWKKKFSLLDRTSFYNFEKSKLKLNQAPEIYRDLSQTDFPSLYGSGNPYDDFAEAFLIYIHVKTLNKPYLVEVLKIKTESRRVSLL